MSHFTRGPARSRRCRLVARSASARPIMIDTKAAVYSATVIRLASPDRARFQPESLQALPMSRASSHERWPSAIGSGGGVLRSGVRIVEIDLHAHRPEGLDAVGFL